jgi:hypothetical protein
MDVQYQKLDTQITNIEHYVWGPLATGDTGVSFKFAKPTDKTYHIYGTFSGATVTLYGSNDLRADPLHPDHASAEWFTLTNIKTDSIALSSAGGGVIAENPLYMKCDVTGGSGSGLTVSIIAKKVF